MNNLKNDGLVKKITNALFRTKAKKELNNIQKLLGLHYGGVYKRIDEGRELLELMRDSVPDFLEKNPWVVDGIKSTDVFLTELSAATEITVIRFAPRHDFPRQWPIEGEVNWNKPINWIAPPQKQKPTIPEEFWNESRARFDSHAFFKTISHQHVSDYSRDETCDVMIVECADGRWYIEDNWGDVSEKKSIEDVFNPFDKSSFPTFFPDRDSAELRAAQIVSSITGISVDEMLG